MMEEESEGENGWNGAGGAEGGPTFGLGFLFGLQREDDHQSPHDALQTSAAIWKCSSARRSANAQAALTEAKRKKKKADVKKRKRAAILPTSRLSGRGGAVRGATAAAELGIPQAHAPTLPPPPGGPGCSAGSLLLRR